MACHAYTIEGGQITPDPDDVAITRSQSVNGVDFGDRLVNIWRGRTGPSAPGVDALVAAADDFVTHTLEDELADVAIL